MVVVRRRRKVWPLYLGMALVWTLWQGRFLFQQVRKTTDRSPGAFPPFWSTSTATNAADDQQCPIGTALRRRHGPSIKLVDTQRGLRIMSAPKGGASLMAQLFFRHLGLLEKAQEYHDFVHFYRNKWLRENPQERAECNQVCPLSNWTCVQLIRSPLDRAVSSYIHTMRTEICHRFPELHEHQISQQQRHMNLTHPQTVDNASFADFLRALQRRAAADLPPHPRIQSFMDDHFMPQSEFVCHMPSPHMYYVPIEAIHPALNRLAQITGVHLNASGLSSGHYVTKLKTPATGQPIPDVSHVPFLSLKLVQNGGVSLPYKAYLQNDAVNKLLCRLFCHDIALYRNACTAAWLGETALQICRTQLERINQVCGES